jgi:hypothetical protein
VKGILTGVRPTSTAETYTRAPLGVEVMFNIRSTHPAGSNTSTLKAAM